MNNIAIKAEDLSKVYQLGQIGTGTLSKDLEHWWSRLRGREASFLKVDQQPVASKNNLLWSLKDLSFEIHSGTTVGIVGNNGAGKSTLLKVLSRITSPTTGTIKIKGRIASLLEIGTGFHPELTGRENIYLNGAILGMRKAEIRRNFDAIVDFAEVGPYIDTPVKRYSSGMYVRLAFAVAAHLQSEILIVDEVLAVGDAAFQKKCLGEMGRLSSAEGRTILFVSHNIAAIRSLCSQGIYLQNGQIALNSGIEEVISAYSQTVHNLSGTLNHSYIMEHQNLSCRFKQVTIVPNGTHGDFDLNQSLEIKVILTHHIPDVVVSMQVMNEMDISLLHSSSEFMQPYLNKKTETISCRIPPYLLNEGLYRFQLTLAVRNKEYLDHIELCIRITDSNFNQPLTASTDWKGLSSPKILTWH